MSEPLAPPPPPQPPYYQPGAAMYPPGLGMGGAPPPGAYYMPPPPPPKARGSRTTMSKFETEAQVWEGRYHTLEASHAQQLQQIQQQHSAAVSNLNDAHQRELKRLEAICADQKTELNELRKKYDDLALNHGQQWQKTAMDLMVDNRQASRDHVKSVKEHNTQVTGLLVGTLTAHYAQAHQVVESSRLLLPPEKIRRKRKTTRSDVYAQTEREKQAWMLQHNGHAITDEKFYEVFQQNLNFANKEYQDEIRKNVKAKLSTVGDAETMMNDLTGQIKKNRQAAHTLKSKAETDDAKKDLSELNQQYDLWIELMEIIHTNIRELYATSRYGQMTGKQLLDSVQASTITIQEIVQDTAPPVKSSS